MAETSREKPLEEEEEEEEMEEMEMDRRSNLTTPHRWLAPVAVAALTLGACGSTPSPSPESTASGAPSTAGASTAPESPAEAGGELTLHWDSAPKSFNPFPAISSGDWYPMWFIFDQLVHLDERGDVVPQLADSWDISPDGRVYTFHLRPGVKWHDGQPLTAKDVVFTYTMLVDKRSQSAWQALMASVKGADDYQSGRATSVSGLKAIDDDTVSFELNAPNAGFLATFGFPIVPEHVLGQVPADGDFSKTDFGISTPIGTGPFKIGTYVRDQSLELLPNPDYFGGAPKLIRLTLRLLDAQVAVAGLETGDIDAMLVSPDDVDRLKALQTVQIQPVPTGEWRGLYANLERPLLQDKRVREAILIAIDREMIVKTVLKGFAKIRNTEVATPEWAVNHDLDNVYPYNPERAKQLLAEAGWKPGTQLAITASSDKPWFPVWQQQLAAVGIDLKIKVEDTPTYVDDYNKGNFDLFQTTGDSGADPDYTSIYFDSKNVPPAGANSMHYSNARVDELLKLGRETTDQAKRAEIYKEYAKILSDDLPILVFWNQYRILAVNAKASGNFVDVALTRVPGTIPESNQWTIAP